MLNGLKICLRVKLPIGFWGTMIIGGNSKGNTCKLLAFFRLGTRFGAGNIDGFNMMSLMLPGVAVTYNGEEIGMTNTEVSWEDTVDPAGLNCGEEHFNVSREHCVYY